MACGHARPGGMNEIDQEAAADGGAMRPKDEARVWWTIPNCQLSMVGVYSSVAKCSQVRLIDFRD